MHTKIHEELERSYENEKLICVLIFTETEVLKIVIYLPTLTVWFIFATFDF